MVESQTSMLESVAQTGESIEIDDVAYTFVSPSKTALTSAVIQEASEISESSVSVSIHGLGNGTNEVKSSGQDRAHSPNSEPDWDGPVDHEENSRNKYDESFIYLNTCKRMGIVPVSYFLRNITFSEINLKHHGLGPRGTKAICLSLTSNSTVTNLNLSDNGLGPSGAIALADMLKDNCYISELDVSFNKIGNTGVIALSQVMLDNSTVTRCNLSNNDLDNKCSENLAELLKCNFSLSHLDLSHNKLEEEAGVFMGPSLGENEVLKSLDLSWNSITGKGAISIAQVPMYVVIYLTICFCVLSLTFN
ncbi:Leucine-rich repeat-containing protein 74B [Oopsacas minuta]|uniref:Leucine-rich repeat-containing protein 74B n=1 Tax=Oopsacas minuta TaxID=111878 RepID=A0AAV7KAM0_9METZ|nr:Leucine-rich repeat-containing protein 74B [Oopsacas minuta]